MLLPMLMSMKWLLLAVMPVSMRLLRSGDCGKKMAQQSVVALVYRRRVKQIVVPTIFGWQKQRVLLSSAAKMRFQKCVITACGSFDGHPWQFNSSSDTSKSKKLILKVTYDNNNRSANEQVSEPLKNISVCNHFR
jgi:hypothetical protein